MREREYYCKGLAAYGCQLYYLGEKGEGMMSTFSKKIKKGLEEILEYEQGKRTLNTKVVDLPEPRKSKNKKKTRENC